MSNDVGNNNGVKEWAKEDGIDNKFGYNDFLIATEKTEKGELNLTSINHFSEGTAQEVAEKGTVLTVDQYKASPYYRKGDQIFRYGENGPLIVRRSIFADECPKVDSNNLYPLQSEDEVRAFAAFSGGKALDDLWCSNQVDGLESENSIRTPWDLETVAGLEAMKRALTAIKDAKTNPSKDKEGLVAKLDTKRLDAIENDLDNRMSSLKEKTFHDQPWYAKLWDGTITGTGFAVGGGAAVGVWVGIKKGLTKLGWIGKAASVVLIVGGALLTSEEAQAATTEDQKKAPSKGEPTGILGKVLVEIGSAPFWGVSETIIDEETEQRMLEESRRLQEARRKEPPQPQVSSEHDK